LKANLKKEELKQSCVEYLPLKKVEKEKINQNI